MSTEANVEVMLEIFRAIERRDLEGFLGLCRPDVEFHWPPSLPYGGTSPSTGWAETWVPLQPTPAEQRMDPRVVAARDDEVVVLWHQRGAIRSGERFDAPVLALYHVCEGKLARAQMFYFDTVPLVRFLAHARSTAAGDPTP